MYTNILVPLDGSKRAEAIIDHALHVAKQNNAKVMLLKVEDPVMLDRDEVIDFPEYRMKLQTQKKQTLSYLNKVQELFIREDIQSDSLIAYGPVVRSILAAATETHTDLIAMATHGIGGLKRVSYGSVAAGVLQAAEIPILLIRSGDTPSIGG